MISKSVGTALARGNPLLTRVWATPFQLPPFPLIQPDHFLQAIPVCMEEHNAEIAAILAVNPDKANFETIVAAYDRSGSMLKRARRLFDNLCSSCSSEELQQVQRELAAPLASHDSDVFMSGLYEKIAAVRGEPGLAPEQERLVERLSLDFVREGACFEPALQAKYKCIVCRLAVLLTEFAQNVLADESGTVLELDLCEAEGLPAWLLAAARTPPSPSATRHHAVSLSRSMVIPVLTFSENVSLRERVWSVSLTLHLFMCYCFVSYLCLYYFV